jgi:hypothetical protein
MHGLRGVQRKLQDNDAAGGLTDEVRPFDAQVSYDRPTVRRLLFKTDRDLRAGAVPPAPAMIVDETILANEGWLGNYCGALVAHSTMDKHNGFPRTSVPDFQFSTVDLGTFRGFSP